MPRAVLRSTPFRSAIRFLGTTCLAAAALTGVSVGHASLSASAATTTAPPYWIANPQGSVWNFGSAGSYGSMAGKTLNKPIVAIAPTPDAKGYWLTATDGGIFAFGDARFLGSTGNIRLNKPIVGMTPTASNNGYWMVASDGGIFAYGDAPFYGSTGNIRLNKPIVGMSSTPDGHGYWLVASDGGIFAYGDAAFYGSTGSIHLNKPIVGMAPTPTGHGYWLVASDGGIFAYGDAKFYGSPGGSPDTSYAKIISAPDGKGYWLLRNGGDATAYGSVAVTGSSTTPPTRPAVGLIYNINGPGDLAVQYAMAQLGVPYVYGGASTAGFDCSGLMLRAWEQGGVELPRVANDQYDSGGPKVTLDQIKPGDIVFWATDITNSRTIYHDAIYIGGGYVVNAPQTGDVVRTRTLYDGTPGLMPYAVRPRS